MLNRLLALALTLLTLGGALADAEKTVSVTGTATVLMDADTASISLGVVSVAKEAGEASRMNAERVDQLIAALEALGEKPVKLGEIVPGSEGVILW